MEIKRTNFFGDPKKVRARVILRPDGYVHIAFESSTSILATGRAVLELFQDPIAFIEEGCTKYQVSTNGICRVRQKTLSLEAVLGLDLAYVTGDRQIVCDFTELFAWVSNRIGTPELDQPLILSDIVCNTDAQQLSDEKALLLRYYLEVGRFLSKLEPPAVKRHLKLRDEVQLSVIKVAMDVFTSPQEKASPKRPAISDRIESAIPIAEAQEPKEAAPVLLSTKECAERLGYTAQQIRNKIASGEIKGVKDDKGNFKIREQDLPKKKTKSKVRASSESLAGNYEETQKNILENGLFTQAVAPFIMSHAEMEFFAAQHREVVIDGRAALVLDIHPEFIAADGRTNRQRILDGEAPICPSSPEGNPYHLHHMSKRMTGPLAIVSTEDHRKYNKFLHQAPNDPDMYRTTFDMQRISFYRSYLEMYDIGGYDAMPYLNRPKSTASDDELKSKSKKQKTVR